MTTRSPYFELPHFCKSHDADLLHQSDLIIEEFFLHNLAIFPMGDRAKLELEAFVRGGNLFAVRRFHCARKLRNRARPISLSKETL